MINRATIQAVIFDLDGVLVNSEPYHEKVLYEMFDSLGYGETHGMHLPDYYGRTDRALLEDFVARHQPASSLDQLVEWKQNRTIEMLREEQPIFPEIPELVSQLARCYRLAVASGSVHELIQEVLAMHQLRRYFSVVVSSHDVMRGKPAPDVFSPSR